MTDEIGLIGGTLKTLRSLAGLSLREAATSAGIRTRRLSRLEQNETEPTFAEVASILRVYGCSVDDLSFPLEQIAPRTRRDQADDGLHQGGPTSGGLTPKPPRSGEEP